MKNSRGPKRPQRPPARAAVSQLNDAGPRVGAKLALEIDNLSDEGAGVARHDGLAVFVDGALPGEKVQARITARKRRHAQAEALEVLSPSEHRRQPQCDLFGRCGGCQLQHIDHDAQLQYKQAQLLDALKRHANLEPRTLLPALKSSPLAYRRRARFGVRVQKNKLCIGLRQSASEQLIDVAHCPVLVPQLQLFLQKLRAQLDADLSIAKQISHIQFLAGDDCAVAILRIPGAASPALGQALAAIDDDATRILLQVDHRSEGQHVLSCLQGKLADPRLHYYLKAMANAAEEEGNIDFGFAALDFIQGNANINTALVELLLQELRLDRKAKVLDLFCGIGNFTLPLARVCAEVHAVEVVAEMVQRLRDNASHNRLENITAHVGDLDGDWRSQSWVKSGPYQALVLDPPRAGAKALCEGMGRLKIPTLAYISCNPSTLVRDAGALAAQGYKLDRLAVVDMFPQTRHSEALAIFQRS